MSKVNVKGSHLEKALKVLKKRLAREGVLKELYERQFFEKPSVKKYKRKKLAKHVAKLTAEEDRQERLRV